ncbi:MAG: hypothetical protein OEX07_09645 [Gammaproteobacteria bacterium]|nr:hypothetical protein [Gammaproteobacteria bacterium]
MAKQDVTVLVGTIDDGEKTYGPGDSLKMNDKEIPALVKAGIIKEGVEKKPFEMSDDRMIELFDAFDQLEKGNEAHWTNSNKPEVAALKDILDGDVSADERDHAWKQYQEENK